MEKTQLEVGDLICETNVVDRRKDILKVTRVTNKFAFVAIGTGDYEQKFNRNIRGGSISDCNRPPFSHQHYAIATEQDHKDIQLGLAKSKVKARFSKVADKLSLSQCEAIMAILNSVTT